MVAVVQVRGLLCTEVSVFDCGFSDAYSGDGSIVDQAREADADRDVCAIVFDVLSPGGDAMGCGEAAEQLAALRSASSKPWLVYARQATSAAYWLSAAAAGEGGLFVSQSSDVANVGTRCWHVDYSKSNQQEGITVTHLGNPAGKTLGNEDEPLADEARARIERGLAETTARFAAAVASWRPGLAVEAIVGLNADTRRGAAAVEAGLADGLAGSLDEVVVLAHSMAAALAAEPNITTPAGIAPAPKGPADVKPTAALLSLVPGLNSSASDAAIEAAVLPLLTLANTARAIAGKDDPEAAAGVLRAHATLAAEVPALRAKVDATSARAEEVERVQELEGAVKEGVLKPGEVWTWTAAADPKEPMVRGIAPVWAAPAGGIGKTMPALRAELAHLRAVGPRTLAATKAEEAKVPTGAEVAREAAVNALDPNQLRFCQARGVDPAKFSALYASNFGAQSGAQR